MRSRALSIVEFLFLPNVFVILNFFFVHFPSALQRLSFNCFSVSGARRLFSCNWHYVPELGIGSAFSRALFTSVLCSSVCPIKTTSRFWMCHTICWMVLCQVFLSLLLPPLSPIKNLLSPSPLGRPDTQASYSAIVGAGAKKMDRGRGRGEEETLARKPHHSGKRPLIFYGSVHL